MDLATWRSAAWLDEALHWAGQHVAVSSWGPLRARPWSAVLPLATDRGRVFLKAASAATAFEVGLYDVLLDLVPDAVLHPIALDRTRAWVLLPDGGPSIGEGLDDRAACEALVATLPAYGAVQRDLAPHVDALLATGVEDLRPAALPARFNALLASTAATLATDPDRVLHRRVAALAPTVAHLSAALSQSPLTGTLDHNDLHPHNVLPGPCWFDWGDAVIAHPLASGLVPLRFVHDTLGPAARAAAGEVYAAGFGADPTELDLACRLAKIARAHVWERALSVAREQGEPLEEWFLRAPLEWLGGLLQPGFGGGG